jgi:hypothetical protein
MITTVRFPVGYPLEELAKKDEKEILQAMLPYVRWTKREFPSLTDLCIHAIYDAKKQKLYAITNENSALKDLYINTTRHLSKFDKTGKPIILSLTEFCINTIFCSPKFDIIKSDTSSLKDLCLCAIRRSSQRKAMQSAMPSLKDRCINAIHHAKAATISIKKILPEELWNKLLTYGLLRDISEATKLIFHVIPSNNTPQTKNLLYIVNNYVFDGFMAALPSVDVRFRRKFIDGFSHIYKIPLCDFPKGQPVLQLKEKDDTRGVSFLIETEDGYCSSLTFLQWYDTTPDQWFFQVYRGKHSAYLAERRILWPILPESGQEIVATQDADKQAKQAVEEVANDNDPLSLLDYRTLEKSVNRLENRVYLAVKMFRHLVLGRPIIMRQERSNPAHGVCAAYPTAYVKASLAIEPPAAETLDQG